MQGGRGTVTLSLCANFISVYFVVGRPESRGGGAGIGHLLLEELTFRF